MRNQINDWLLLMLLGALLGCETAAPEMQHFPLKLRAQSPSGVAVPDVRFWADGEELGITDAEGALLAKLRGREGQPVSLSIACPVAYRTPEPRRRFVLRGVRAHAGHSGAANRPPELTAQCEPLERLAAVVVYARGSRVAGLPIKVGGVLVGQTQADGTAHVLVRARPHSSLVVELDTTHRPELSPINPVQTFQLGDNDDVLLFEQELAMIRKPAKVRRTRALDLPERLPYRID